MGAWRHKIQLNWRHISGDPSCSPLNAIISICHSNIAQIKIQEERYEDGIEECIKAIENDDTNVKAWFRRGLCYYKANEYLNSLANFLKAKELEPENKTILNWIEKTKISFVG